MSDSLAIYLHDHLGGSEAAIDLLKAMRDHQKDEQLREFAIYLLAEFQADRDTLQRLAEQVRSGSSVLKQFTGWFGEKAARLKLGQGSGEDFETFEALEFLALGTRQNGDVASPGCGCRPSNPTGRIRLQNTCGPRK